MVIINTCLISLKLPLLSPLSSKQLRRCCPSAQCFHCRHQPAGGELEADLHVQLLYRTTRRVSLTEMGAEYYQQCKKALEGLADAERTISASQAVATGH